MNLDSIWTLLNSPAIIAAFAAVVVYLLNRLYAAKPTWKGYEGTIISAVKLAEKSIPDDTDNKHLARFDYALRYVLSIWEATEGKTATSRERHEIADAISAVHADLEAAGNLDKPAEGPQGVET